ncbi:MAG: CPBP family intramembrane metalloprotease [Chloroflexi bacterium]|nr:CPBP family intramembrane metalloprotease [Chloroflexota bacterium]
MYLILITSILGISFAIGFAASGIWNKNSAQWKAFPTFYTFLPAVVSILVFHFLQRTWSFGYLSFNKFDLVYVAAGIVIPLVVFIVNVFLMRFVFHYQMKDGIDWRKSILELPLNVLLILIFIAGEEIGWRGFLQKLLIDEFGVVTGIVILGLVWGIWHAPIALKGYNMGSHFWAEAFILYPFMCVCLSMPMALITIQSGSIWPALLFHAVNNSLGGIGLMFFDRKGSLMDIVPNIVTGVLLLLPFAFFL